MCAAERDPKGAERSSRCGEGCLTDAEVVAFVDGTLSEDEREPLHQHLDGCEACRDLLNEAVKALDPTIDTLTSRTEDDFATTFRPGTLVAERYEIRRFLARGGMGEVYEAYDRQLNERVALKAVSSAACDSQRAIRDLIAEVGLARRVTHPNVCRIYDLGTHVLASGASLYFLTMEFVDGKTLGHLIRRNGALPLEEAQRYARALLEGLSAAHKAGILHRDFKSDNVILRTEADGRRTPVILDFGLARTLDERSRARSSQQAFVGTLTYMAPEQVEGKKLSKGTDIYAFGVVWFEMLTGKLPFAGSPQLSALERLSKPPAPPSQFNPSIPPELDAIITRCLERIPEKRFQGAEEVLEALPNAFVLSERQPSSSRRRVVRKSAVAVIAGVTLAGALAGLIPAGRSEGAKPPPLPPGPVPTLTQPEPAPAEEPQPVPTAKPEEDAATPVASTTPIPEPRRPRLPPNASTALGPMLYFRSDQPVLKPQASSSARPLSNTFKQFELKKKTSAAAASAESHLD